MRTLAHAIKHEPTGRINPDSVAALTFNAWERAGVPAGYIEQAERLGYKRVLVELVEVEEFTA